MNTIAAEQPEIVEDPEGDDDAMKMHTTATHQPEIGRPEALLGLNINYGPEGSIALYAGTYINKIAQRFNFEHYQNKKSYSIQLRWNLDFI